MISVRDLIEAVLFNTDETYNRIHSDPEIIHAINSVLRIFNLSLVNFDSYLLMKKITITPISGKVKLPTDFVKIVSFDEDFFGKYTVIGSYLYIDENTTMIYMRTLPEVATTDDSIDLPNYFFEMYVRYVSGILKGNLDSDKLAALVGSDIQKLSFTASKAFIDRPMPYFI